MQKVEGKDNRKWGSSPSYVTLWACLQKFCHDPKLCPDPKLCSCCSKVCSPKPQPYLSEALIDYSSAVLWSQPHPSYSSEQVIFHPESYLVWPLCQIPLLTSFLSCPPFYHTLNCYNMRAVPQNRIWSLSISYGLKEWTGLLLVSYTELISCLLGLLLSFLNNSCL